MTDKSPIKTFSFKPSSIEIELKELAFIKELPKLMGSPHRVSFYQLMWITRGEAKHRIDFREISIATDEILILSPGQVCEFDIRSDYDGKMILFTNTFFTITEVDSDFLYSSQILRLSDRNPTVKMCTQFMTNLLSLLEEELQNKTDKFQTAISQSLLRIILFEAERTLSKAYPLSSIARLGQSFFNAVEKNFTENKQTDFYADLLAVSNKVLSKEIKSITGDTPKVYIDKRIMLEAKRMLAYSNLSVKEIGFSLGFDEPGNFTHFFRKCAGITPAGFRDSLQ